MGPFEDFSNDNNKDSEKLCSKSHVKFRDNTSLFYSVFPWHIFIFVDQTWNNDLGKLDQTCQNNNVETGERSAWCCPWIRELLFCSFSLVQPNETLNSKLGK